jgi:quinol monooxygenase YgiN
MIVRISKGSFPPDRLGDAEDALTGSEAALRDALVAMPGLLHYYVAIDREQGQLTNVSVWDTMEHAHAMYGLPEMLAQRPVLEAAGVTFEAITNHETVWTITP